MQQPAHCTRTDVCQEQQLLRERQATHFEASTSSMAGTKSYPFSRGETEQLSAPVSHEQRKPTSGAINLPALLEHTVGDSRALQTQGKGARPSLTLHEGLQGEAWMSERTQVHNLASQQSPLGTTWLEGQTDPLLALSGTPSPGQAGATAPVDLGVGDLPPVPQPSPLVGGHTSPSEVLTFDSIFQNIMDQKAMQAQQQPDLNDQRISATPSDLSTRLHMGHPGSALSHQASLEQFQQSQIGRSLSNQASLGQLLHLVSMDRLLEMTNELFIPALDTDGGWDVDGTPLSLFRFGGLTPEVPLPAIVNRDGTTSPSLSPQGIGPSMSPQAVDLAFGAPAAVDFAERPPEVTVTLVPRTACSGQRTDKIQLQLEEDSSPAQQPRKRRRAGEVPPKLAAILENERSPPPETEDAEAADAAGSQLAAGSQMHLEGLSQSSADVRRDKNREAARRMRLKKQQALANLQTEVGELEAQNTTLISRLESLLNWLEGTNKENSMLRQLLKCLDIPIESRSTQPALAQLHKVKTALSGPANPLPASLPSAAQLPAAQSMPEHLSPQLHAAIGKHGFNPVAAELLVHGQQIGQHDSSGLFISEPAQSPCKQMSPLRLAPFEGACVSQGLQETGRDAPAIQQGKLPSDQHTAEMGPPSTRTGRPLAASMQRTASSAASAAANTGCSNERLPAPVLCNVQKDLPGVTQLMAPQQRLPGSRSTVLADTSAQQVSPAGAYNLSALAPQEALQQSVASVASELTCKPEGVP